MAKKSSLQVKGTLIRTLHQNGIDYICITDIARQKNQAEPKDVVKNWMRLKNTLEYLGLWEQVNNPMFKGVEFDPLLIEAGSNAFTMSPSRWVELTGAIGILSKSGAGVNELICLSNMESLNAVFINEGLSQRERLIKLNQIAIQQMRILEDTNRKLLK